MENYLENRYLRLPDGTFPHMGVTEGDVNPYVILCGNPERVERIQKYLDNASLVGEKRGFIVYSGSYKNVPISVASNGMGCPAVAVAVEELAAVGGETFIRVGSCASIHPQAEIGSTIIATAAARDEGTSKYYAPDIHPAVADHHVTQALHEASEQQGVPYFSGVVRSTDSFYRGERTRKIIDRWRELGVLAFDMESSTLFTVASQFSCRSGSILVPGSNLITGHSTYQGHSIKEYDHGIETIITITLNTASQLKNAI